MIGEQIEQYRILDVVGRGGMGVVYRAVDVNLDRTVAIKVLSAELRGDPDFVARFRHEARVQAALNHPNVATLFGFLIWKESPVAVMEFIEGETLQGMIQRRGPIPAHLALPMFQQALAGVAAGHRRGIIHRDLKPANLMINQEGVVKVTDFGIAKVNNAPGLTMHSTRIGSSYYMSPEQILGRPVDTRTDIYALGITLYELLSGQTPFRATTQFEVETAHVREAPPPPTIHYPHIPPVAVDAVMRALEKEPDKRFANVEEFMRALPDMRGVPYIGPSIARAPATPPPAAPPPSSPDITTPRGLDPDPGPQPSAHGGSTPAGGVTQTTLRRAAVAAAFIAVIGGVYLWVHQSRALSTGAATREPPTMAQLPQPAPQVSHDAGPDAAKPAQSPFLRPLEPDEGPPPAALNPPHEPRAPPPAPTRATPPAGALAKDLSGTWTGEFADPTTAARVRIKGLDMHELQGGAISGTLVYATDAGAEGVCKLNPPSQYLAQGRRLTLYVYCANPDHPKYLNFPLDFTDVDPHAASLQTGQVQYYAARVSVRLSKRTTGI